MQHHIIDGEPRAHHTHDEGNQLRGVQEGVNTLYVCPSQGQLDAQNKPDDGTENPDVPNDGQRKVSGTARNMDQLQVRGLFPGPGNEKGKEDSRCLVMLDLLLVFLLDGRLLARQGGVYPPDIRPMKVLRVGRAEELEEFDENPV